MHLIGYSPAIDMVDGIKQTVNWFYEYTRLVQN